MFHLIYQREFEAFESGSNAKRADESASKGKWLLLPADAEHSDVIFPQDCFKTARKKYSKGTKGAGIPKLNFPRSDSDAFLGRNLDM